MKAVTKSKDKTSEPLEQRFNRFAKALMAVPKKELDRELEKHERKKERSQRKRNRLKES